MQSNTNSSAAPIAYYLSGSTFLYTTMPVWPNGVSNYTVKIRTAIFNANLACSTNFLMFSNKKLEITTNLTSNIETIYNITSNINANITEVCFGNSMNEIFILQLESGTGICPPLSICQTLTFLNNSIQISKILLSQLISANLMKTMKFANNKLFIYFTYILLVYDVNTNSTISSYWNLSHSGSAVTTIDIKIYDDEIILSSVNRIEWWNLTTKNSIKTQTGLAGIQCITRIAPYLIVRAGNNITQYNESNMSSVYTYRNTQTYYYQCETIGNNYLLLFSDYGDMNILEYFSLTNQTIIPINNTNITFNNINTTNITNTTNNNINSTNIINTINITHNNTINNIIISNNTTNNNTINNINTNNNNTNINSNIIIISNEENNNIFNISPEIDEILNNISTQFGRVLIISSMRISPKFLLYFLLFLDDLWLYKFHRKYNPEYPNTTQFFMQKIDLIKNIQTSVNFSLNSNIITYNEVFLINKNNEYLNYSEFNNHDPNNIYFLYSINDIYLNSIPFNIIFFISLKVFQLVLYISKKKMHFIEKIYNYLKCQTRWWTLIVAIIESNITILIYSSALEFNNNTFLDLFDRFNYISFIFFLFISLVYALTFYPLIFSSDKQINSTTLLVRCKYNYHSFWNESTLIVSRSVLKSFVHGFFISNYNIQIILLFLLDIPYIILAIRMRKYFINAVLFVLMLLYLIGFAALNFYFVLEIFEPKELLQSNREMFGLVISLYLAILSILLALVFLFFAFYDIFLCFKSNSSIKSHEENSNQYLNNKIDIQETQENIIKLKRKITKEITKIHCNKITHFEKEKSNFAIKVKINKNKISENFKETAYKLKKCKEENRNIYLHRTSSTKY